MDVEGPSQGARVSIMTLHGAKGLEFDIVFLPGGRRAFSAPAVVTTTGAPGSRRSAASPMSASRAPREAKIYHAANRRVRGLWQSSIPSRFIGELPPDHAEFEEETEAPAFGGYGVSRFDGRARGFSSRYDTPGWRRAEERSRHAAEQGARFRPAVPGRTLEGQAQRRPAPDAGFEAGARVFHLKFGPGSVVAADGPKLTVDFDRAGRKLVMDSFVTAQG